MTLQQKLELFVKEWTTLQSKIKTAFQQKEKQIQQKDQTITEITQQKQEVTTKLELQLKENSANEKVLETLLKEFAELTEQLE